MNERSPTPAARFSFSEWEKAREHILNLMHLEENWDGEGASSIHSDLIRSALHLIEQMKQDGNDAPQDVYPLSDGTIILEWQMPKGVIQRIEIDGVGRGEMMITYPNAPANFSEVALSYLSWRTI